MNDTGCALSAILWIGLVVGAGFAGYHATESLTVVGMISVTVLLLLIMIIATPKGELDNGHVYAGAAWIVVIVFLLAMWSHYSSTATTEKNPTVEKIKHIFVK